jgi:phage terminase large subunit-like protein
MTKQERAMELARNAALSSLEQFIRLIHPQRHLPQCHVELINWWTREDAKSHQLVLLPRDHGKSAMIAYRVAWEITKNPAIRVLYISSTSNLATKQLKFIKDILVSPIYRKYWPDMVNIDDQKREKWTESEISVDHPLRKAKIIRDPTIFTAGLTTGITGLHCDIAVMDDVVVEDNAYTDEGREKAAKQISYLSSIATADARTWAVGTRYHPEDLYETLRTQIVEMYDKYGDIKNSYHLFEVYEQVVEDAGDGTGNFLWPRAQAPTGDWFGFNQEILAKKKAGFANAVIFRAQYYNNPNDYGSAAINHDMFQYYDKRLLVRDDGYWTYKGTRLNVFAGVDFAFSLAKDADYTAIVVVGVDSKFNYYVLDVVRFKTNKISEYFDYILRLYTKWGFRKLRAETTVAQTVIVKDLKDNYIRPQGLVLSIEEHRPLKNKEERIEAALQPRYSNRQMWHYRGGHCELLEEELVLQNPAHDDIKDCLASVVEMAVPPSPSHAAYVLRKSNPLKEYTHSRFGGIH